MRVGFPNSLLWIWPALYNLVGFPYQFNYTCASLLFFCHMKNILVAKHIPAHSIFFLYWNIHPKPRPKTYAQTWHFHFILKPIHSLATWRLIWNQMLQFCLHEMFLARIICDKRKEKYKYEVTMYHSTQINKAHFVCAYLGWSYDISLRMTSEQSKLSLINHYHLKLLHASIAK